MDTFPKSYLSLHDSFEYTPTTSNPNPIQNIRNKNPNPIIYFTKSNSLISVTIFNNNNNNNNNNKNMIGSSEQKPPSIYNRSYTINSSFTNSPVKASLQRSESVKKVSDSIKGKVKTLCSIFEARRSPKPKPEPEPKPGPIRLPGTNDRVVIYFTSLRGIRRTYEDCYSVRTIFKFFRVYIDERDISMDNAYRNQLSSLLGQKQISLPQVFIKGEYVGGADVIKQLHETGQLAKVLTGLPVVRSTAAAWLICEACGDVRFVPCVNCSGSKKVFDEDEDRLKRCPHCNENGLVRCPTCCS